MDPLAATRCSSELAVDQPIDQASGLPFVGCAAMQVLIVYIRSFAASFVPGIDERTALLCVHQGGVFGV